MVADEALLNSIMDLVQFRDMLCCLGLNLLLLLHRSVLVRERAISLMILGESVRTLIFSCVFAPAFTCPEVICVPVS